MTGHVEPISDFQPSDELVLWLELLVEDALAPDQHGALERLLEGNAGARRWFVRHLQFQAALSWDAVDWEAGSMATGERVLTAPSPTPASPLALATLLSPSSVCQEWRFAYLVATVIVGIGLALAAVTHVSPPVRSPREIADYRGEGSSTPISIPTPSTDCIGRITGMIDCVWERTEDRGQGAEDREQGSRFKVEDSVGLGQRIALRSGLLEITYDSGAKVILQGPVRYKVESADGGYLAIGKLTACVEKGSRNKVQGSTSELSPLHSPLSTLHSPLFTIITPTAIVTDLGTEFGVEVDRNQATETHVIAGRVVMTSTSHNVAKRSERILSAGSAARVESVHSPIIETKIRTGKFMREMPDRKSTNKEADIYAAMVLAMRPVAYYRMEQPRDEANFRKMVDASPYARHGVVDLCESDQPWLTGRFGDAFFCRGTNGCNGAVVADYPISRDGCFSVSAWVFAEARAGMAKIAANWGSSRRGQFNFGLFFEDGDLCVAVGEPDRNELFVREGRGHRLPVRKWQHVAFTCDNAMLRLYRNGVEVASGAIRGVMTTPELSGLSIGNKLGDDGQLRPDNHWRGRIDELVIFGRTLTPGEIRDLAASNDKVN